MSTPLPPDPYIALGLTKNATPAQIKTTYRKLVLKCHPDKVVDESKKAQAADQFHQIQQAYELLGDEGRRSRYDAQVKLADLRKQAMGRQSAPSPRSDVKTAAYEMPTASPGRATFSSRGPDRVYEERKPPKSYDGDNDYFGDTRTTSRKYDDYDRGLKKPAAPRDDRERTRTYDKESERVARADKRRTRDKETRREREQKFPRYPSDDSEPDLRYEALRRREEEKKKDDERERIRERVREEERERERERERTREREDLREREREREREKERERERERERDRERGREKERERSTYDKTARRYSHIEEKARAYVGKDRRPSTSRAPSAAYVERPADRRPAMVRRNSTKPKISSPAPSTRRAHERERKLSVPDIAEFPDEKDRRTAAMRPTTLHTSQSSPANIKLPRDRLPSRSQTTPFDERDSRDVPAPLRRSETMPNVHTSPRRKDSMAQPKASTPRQTDFSQGYPTPSASPDYPPTPSTTKSYRYADDENDYRRTVLPDRRMTRSPSPLRRSQTTSSRYPQPQQPPPIRTNYTHTPTTESPLHNRPSPVRPVPSRQSSSSYYGEMKPQTSKYDYSPVSDRDYDRVPRMASGYSTRKADPAHPSPRPQYTRATNYIY